LHWEFELSKGEKKEKTSFYYEVTKNTLEQCAICDYQICFFVEQQRVVETESVNILNRDEYSYRV